MEYTHEIKRTVHRKVSRAFPHWEVYVRKGEKCVVEKDDGGDYIFCRMSGGHSRNVTRKNLKAI